ncbi:chemotaxis protein CheX [Pelagicoccus sp. SDUM812003]|uniref:chemotaxis protein CheX n=1 Tax=Pelagicoccus sp. SDUM812003 TaxID=3041267 RepID=UPI00280EB1BC|nr:chemotaxis protein CheX [Pelagicoccus sp. SDUM812003]MDQ8201546.1 chemotaxis protein CheX [Pelagicoccus sp. SDUM812003]
MQQTFPISDQELEALSSNAINSVFNTMLDKTAVIKKVIKVDEQTCVEGIQLPVDASAPMIAGTVGFIGNLTGIMYIFMELPLAMEATCKLLDLDEDDIGAEDHELVNDAIGELTNMIVGTFKNDLSNKGFECRMTIPSILRGSNFSIEPAEVALRRIYKFDCGGRSFVIDVLMKEEN